MPFWFHPLLTHRKELLSHLSVLKPFPLLSFSDSGLRNFGSGLWYGELTCVWWEAGTWLHTLVCAYPFLPAPFIKETVSSPLSEFFSCSSGISLLCVHRTPEFSVVTGACVSQVSGCYTVLGTFWSQALWPLEGLPWFPVNFRIISPHLFLRRKSLVFWRLSLEWFLILWELIYLNEKMCPQISMTGYI